VTTTAVAFIRLERAAILAALFIGAATVVLWPWEGAVLGALFWGITLVWLIPSRFTVAIPFVLLLSVPADHIAGLNGPAHGLFVLGVTLALGLSAGLRWGFRMPRSQDWDMHALIAVLCAATLLHAASGELRGILFWMGAGLFLWWLRIEEHGNAGIRSQVATGIVVAGALGGLIAILARVHILDAVRLLPGYQPNELEFTYQAGTRAVGLSGHPLRFGTLTMLAAIFSMAFVLDDRLSRDKRMPYAWALALSLGGLVLSGARGSWLGIGVAIVLFTFIRIREGAGRTVWRIASYGAAAAFLLWATGLWRLIDSRLFGAAAHPGSIYQRLLATEGVRYVWSQVPLFGVGFGGAAEMAMRMGLRLLNLENEYLRFFFTAGVAGPICLIVLGVRRIHAAAVLSSQSPLHMAAVCAVPAALVNIGTYNMFSWSMGPPLLAALAFLAVPLGKPVESFVWPRGAQR
jgi:hypothetical protein